MIEDEELIGKFLPDDILSLFGLPIQSEDDDVYCPPNWLLDSIQQVFNAGVEAPSPPPF